MRNVWMWFYLSAKRCLRRKAFLVILLLLPAAAFGIREIETRDGTEIRIAVAVLSDTGESESGGQVFESGTAGSTVREVPLERALADALIARESRESSGMFRFYECGSEKQVREDVAARRAECGYVISADLRRRLEEKEYKRCIRILTAPSTVAAKLSSEVVAAELLQLFDRELFLSYMAESEIFGRAEQNGVGREDIFLQAEALYQKWKENGSTFHFTYEQVDGAAGEAGRENAGTALFPVRGIAAVYIFAVGIYSAAVTADDVRKGLFLAVSYRLRGLCQLMWTAAPVALAALSGLAALACGGVFRWEQGARELLAMGVYAAAAAVFSWLVHLVCRRAEVIYCLLPVCLIGSLLFCPVFVDISRYLPELGGVGRIFLPWYYLHLG